MSEHTPGPWSVQVEEDDGFQNISIEEIHRCLHDTEWAEPEDFERDLANARRIVACVNACEGMDDPEIEMKQLQAENARLRDLLKWALTYVETEHERGSNHTNEVKMLEIARAALGKED